MAPNDFDGGSFHPGKPGLKKLLGELEADIMQLVWAHEADAVTVREIHERLQETRRIAYTTVMTVMGNLAKKGLLSVEPVGKAYAYRPTQSYEQFTEGAVSRIVEELLKDFTNPAIASFTRAMDQQRP
ncbi:BlaI/MecI/CopY family transcriptional regulator [bacterium]|nr:BlaI/MecI/CopY family transcriptional regulator [bacterium]